MIEALQQFTTLNAKYNFSRGPKAGDTLDAAVREGVNCIWLAHAALDALFGYPLPPKMICVPMSRDKTRFNRLPASTPLQMGDLVWFGGLNPEAITQPYVPRYSSAGKLLNWLDSPARHVGVATGDVDGRGEPLLMHATDVTGGVAVWSLGQFADDPHYRYVQGVSRLRAGSDQPGYCETGVSTSSLPPRFLAR